MSVMVIIHFPAALEAQERLEASTDLMGPIGEIARKHGALSHRYVAEGH